MVKRNRCGMLRNVLDFVRQNYCKKIYFGKKNVCPNVNIVLHCNIM